MTAKTTKGGSDEVEAVPAEEAPEETGPKETAAEETAAEESAAKETAAARRPAARRKRRVRVIEVIDDEDLDDVLEALDAEDAREEAPAEPAAEAEPVAKPKPKPRPTRLEPPEDEVEEEAPKKAAARPSRPASLPDRPSALSAGVMQAVVVVVMALLASLTIWQWRSANSLSAEKDEREAVGEVASAYGDVALNYNAQNYQTQMDKAQKLMGGDLLENFKRTTLPSLGETFKSNPELSLTSKTNQVFVGSVDERFATAAVMVDIDVRTKDGSTAAPATLLRLALAKIDGKWKVTKQYASGTNDQNQNQQSQLPSVPGGGATKSPAAEKSDKPDN
ncbi:hypothetical protein GWI34_01410 [Actinomadura sp. DSM 109109]|nr:hypothetical protein [Actinomadura lepetitiana]